MANDLTTTDQRQITTPSGVQALRRIARLASIAEADVGQARSLLPADAAALIELARDEARASLVPATRRDAKMHLSPTLALVAPVGMGEEEQATWLSTAMHTLSGIPADLLERGCQAARLKVDHPARIVPAIHAAVDEEWRVRRAELGKVDAVAALANLPAIEAPQFVTSEQAAEICAEFGLAGDDRARRPPPATAMDYMAMGLSELEAHKAVADHARALAGDPAPVGAAEPVRTAARAQPPKEIGYGLIAMALARHILARRARRDLTGPNLYLRRFLDTYGMPPFEVLLMLTRQRLDEMRRDIAA